jgi:hypothetical protein
MVRYNSLAQGDPTIIRRDLGVDENFETKSP